MKGKSNLKTQLLISIITGIFIIGGAIISSPHWFKYFFPDQYVEQELIEPEHSKREPDKINEIESDTSNIKLTGTENITIEKLELCPVNTTIPAYFFLEIKNNGTKTLTDLRITIDFGRAKYLELEFLTSENIKSVDSLSNNILAFTYNKLEENESFSIYSLLSQPYFNSIKINGPNLTFAKEYSYEKYLNSDITTRTDLDGFYVFLQFLAAGILIASVVFSFLVIYVKLRKKGLLDLDM